MLPVDSSECRLRSYSIQPQDGAKESANGFLQLGMEVWQSRVAYCQQLKNLLHVFLINFGYYINWRYQSCLTFEFCSQHYVWIKTIQIPHIFRKDWIWDLYAIKKWAVVETERSRVTFLKYWSFMHVVRLHQCKQHRIGNDADFA